MPHPLSSTSVAIATVLAVAATPATAQLRLSGWAAGHASSVNSWAPANGPAATGLAFGFGGGVTLRQRATLEVYYAEGSLLPDETGFLERAFVAGGIAVGVRVAPWLRLQAGTHARSQFTPSRTESWLSWDIGGRVEVPLYHQQLKGDLTLWRAIAATANYVDGAGTGQGGAVGLTLEPFPQPWWIRLAYQVDHATAGVSERDTVEYVTVSLGFGRR